MPNIKKLTGFSSTAIHSGSNSDPNQSHLIPIYASSTYVFDSAEQGMRRFNNDEKGYIYSRWGNPTMTEVEEKISALESFGIMKDEKPIAIKNNIACKWYGCAHYPDAG